MSSSDNLQALVSISEACKILNCHPNTLRDWEKKGLIQSLRFGVRKDRKYLKTDLFNLMNQDGGLEDMVLPNNFDVSRIDMTKTLYEKFAIDEVEKNIQDLVKETIDFFDFNLFKNNFNKKIVFFTEKDFKNCES